MDSLVSTHKHSDKNKSRLGLRDSKLGHNYGNQDIEKNLGTVKQAVKYTRF